MSVNGTRKRRSTSENTLMQSLDRAGIQFLTKGWPDTLCFHNRELVCIEVKRTPRESLKRAQLTVMSHLRSKGIRCVRWDPVSGFRDLEGKLIRNFSIGGVEITTAPSKSPANTASRIEDWTA